MNINVYCRTDNICSSGLHQFKYLYQVFIYLNKKFQDTCILVPLVTGALCFISGSDNGAEGMTLSEVGWHFRSAGTGGALLAGRTAVRIRLIS